MQNASFLIPLLGILGVLLGTVLTAYFAYLRYLRERQHQQETLLNALFGELANINEHYYFVARDMPTKIVDTKAIRLRLHWSIYGEIRSTQNISNYGFLNASELSLLLRLSFLIRNNDRFFELLLSDIQEIATKDLARVKRRTELIIGTTKKLIDHVVIKRPHLQSVFDAIATDKESLST